MPIINVGSTIIDFPDSAASPNWSEAVIQFAQAVANQLNITTGTYDVAPQSFIIDTYNGASNIDIPTLNFPSTAVRAVFISYSVYRETSSENAEESGDMIAVYNDNNAIGLKWTLTRGNVSGAGGQISFNMNDLGQVQFSTVALSGSGHEGKISFSARALEQ